MKRLIDADALIPMMKYATTDSEIGVFPIKIGFNAITEVINNASTIDAVPVIRCKDCARNPNNGKARTICPCPMDRYMGPEGYCSKAELKEADG